MRGLESSSLTDPKAHRGVNVMPFGAHDEEFCSLGLWLTARRTLKIALGGYF